MKTTNTELYAVFVLVPIFLKVTGIITWSWLIILAPLWAPFALGGLLVFLMIWARIIKGIIETIRGYF